MSQWQHLVGKCWAVSGELYHQAFLPHRVWTNKPRNYNCLPAESLIAANNDISAPLISSAHGLASTYWVTCHTYFWWGELNLAVRNDNGGHLNVKNDICQSFLPFFVLQHLFQTGQLKCPVKMHESPDLVKTYSDMRRPSIFFSIHDFKRPTSSPPSISSEMRAHIIDYFHRSPQNHHCGFQIRSAYIQDAAINCNAIDVFSSTETFNVYSYIKHSIHQSEWTLSGWMEEVR